MKKTALLTIMLIFAVASSAYALPYKALWSNDNVVDRSDKTPGAIYDDDFHGFTGDTWTGYYLGTVTGVNSGDEEFENLVAYYLGNASLVTEIYKVDKGQEKEGYPLVVVYDNGNKSGTWSITAQGQSLGFYGVKAATELAIYYVDPAQTSGIWTTAHLLTPNANEENQNKENQPQISHLSAASVSSTPVPEPGTVLLLGAGLLGLALYGRKRLRKM